MLLHSAYDVASPDTNRVTRRAGETRVGEYNQGLDRRIIERLTQHLRHDSATLRRLALMRKVLAQGAGGTVLEIGTKAWQQLIDFEATPPSQLICLNISTAEIHTTIHHSRSPHIGQVTFTVMDAHQIALPDNSVDLVYGVSILHHLDLEAGIREIHRVLKPGGYAIFSEPLRDNPALRLLRALTPQARTADELPFSHAELALFTRYFDVQYDFFQLLSVPAAMLTGTLTGTSDTPMVRAADQVDQWLAANVPPVRTWFRIVTTLLHKPT